MKLTREGKRFLLAVLLLGVAAYNTGNNLTYLIFALMLSLLAISVAVLIINMRGLSLSSRVVGPVFAGDFGELDISVRNRKKLLPSFSLKVVLPEGMRGEAKVPHVAASSAAVTTSLVRFERRGIYKLGSFVLESSFPFIFMIRRVKVSVDRTVTVYPRLVSVEGVDILSGGEGRSYSIRPGHGEDLLTLRKFRQGDDVKLISWKASAKAQSLMVREFAEERSRAINIVLDDSGPSDSEAFERAVSYAASFAVQFIDEGFYVGLVTSAKRLPYGAGQEQLYRILDVLAVARETGTLPGPVSDDDFGTNVMVLKSRASSIRGQVADMVVYAS